ncbi:MAG TPA: hypothetical protein VEZ41_11150 [Allosphingosinicella sp.]|nr:hypothetical protein [Allosphingosinicella sp.]
MIQGINSALIWFFTGIPGVGENLAFLLFLGLLGWAAYLIVRAYLRHHRPMMLALEKRLAILDDVLGGEDLDEQQSAFTRRFHEVDAEMRGSGRQTHDLQRAWCEFKETIVDPNAAPIRNTVRPESFFLHLSDGARGLNWWANIFVALGLTITFLGIVAALAAATDALGTAADPAMMQASLVTLLSVTAAKFWTSVGGVAGSILLRTFDRRWKMQVEAALSRLSDSLENGMHYLPPQTIAASQLEEAREQTTASKALATELAAAIRENFTTAIAPMSEQLGRIHSSMEEFKTGGFNQIGKELGDALSRNAGREMEGLARTLTDMTERLSTIPNMLAGSGEAANRQIETAAREFSVASERMAQVFDGFQSRVETMGARMTGEAEEAANRTASQFNDVREIYQAATEENRALLAGVANELRSSSSEAAHDMVQAVRDAVSGAMAQGREAAQGQLETFATSGAAMQTAFEQLQQRIDQVGAELTRGAGDAASRNAEVLAKAAAALEEATGRASAGMSGAIDEAVRKASDASGAAMDDAFRRFAERFDEASAGLIDTLRGTSARMNEASASIERSARATGEHSTHLERAGAEAQSMAVVLGRAANDVQAATGPIREATETISTSLSSARDLMTAQARAAESNQAAVSEVAARLSETANAATEAWSQYRARFAEVDRALGEALEKIASASSEHAGHLNAHVGKIDEALGTAVSKLSASLTPLTEMAENVEDVLGRLRQAA